MTFEEFRLMRTGEGKFIDPWQLQKGRKVKRPKFVKIDGRPHEVLEETKRGLLSVRPLNGKQGKFVVEADVVQV